MINTHSILPKKNYVAQFRILGKVITIKDRRKHLLLFSERMGFTAKRIGHYSITIR